MSRKHYEKTEIFLIRLNILMDKLGYSNRGQSKFAKKVGVSVSYLNDIINSRSGPSYNLITGIAENFPNVNLHWLLTGEGDLYNIDAPGETSGSDHWYGILKKAREILEADSSDSKTLEALINSTYESMHEREDLKNEVEKIKKQLSTDGREKEENSTVLKTGG